MRTLVMSVFRPHKVRSSAEDRRHAWIRRILGDRLARIRPSQAFRHALDRQLARVRLIFRVEEIAFVVLGGAIGVIAGVAVTAMSRILQLMHESLFAIEHGTRLSAGLAVEHWRAILVPIVGGLVLGAVMSLSGRFRSRRIVDPIEANAIYGGRMSLLDSLGVGLECLISSGTGASVGLEAGYTQVGSGLASKLGEILRLRRNDLRILVGCGAAGAIAAAFDAPLAGAFYAFELVIGGYTVGALAPVVVSALAGSVVAEQLGDHAGPIPIATNSIPIWQNQLPLVLIVAVLASLVGIALMVAVTQSERLFANRRVPPALKPAIGGVVVGMLAWSFPQVLSSGHGALQSTLYGLLSTPLPLREMAIVLLFKAAASAISIGSGFRGGLFFAALFMGALTGGLFAGVINMEFPALQLDPQAYAVIGMSSMAASVIGGPFTMVFLSMEMTGDFALAPLLVPSVLISALTARRLFGFSFATWRFHLRGEAIRSAHDIGWIRNLTVGRLMRQEVPTVRDDSVLTAFRRDFPLGSNDLVVAVDERDRYAGIVPLNRAHALEFDRKAAHTRLTSLLVYKGRVLLPSMNVKEAVAAFEEAEADALVVVDNMTNRHVLGVLTEAHALRRYSEELDQRRRELVGETWHS
jgi:CIC family chloride channel protein